MCPQPVRDRRHGGSRARLSVLVLVACSAMVAGAEPSKDGPPPAPTQATAQHAYSVTELQAFAHDRTPTRALQEANRRLAQALVLQARAWSNPELDVEGARARTTAGDAVSVGRVGLSQRLEWPTKRSSRIEAAQAGETVSEREQRAVLADLDSDVRDAAVEVAVTLRSIDQSRGIAIIARQIATSVERRTEVGEANRSDQLRAEVDALQAEQEVASRERSLGASRAALDALCGGGLAEGFTVDTDLAVLPAISLERALLESTERNPNLHRLAAVVTQRQAEVRREERAAVPDLTAGVFAGREADSRGVGVTLGVAIPLWNRNQGGIEIAKAALAHDEVERKATILRVRQETRIAWYAYDGARDRAQRFAAAMLPRANEALRLALNSYQAGETSLIDLLDARRTAQGVERSHLDALHDAQTAKTRLDRIIGTAVETLP